MLKIRNPLAVEEGLRGVLVVPRRHLLHFNAEWAHLHTALTLAAFPCSITSSLPFLRRMLELLMGLGFVEQDDGLVVIVFRRTACF